MPPLLLSASSDSSGSGVAFRFFKTLFRRSDLTTIGYGLCCSDDGLESADLDSETDAEGGAASLYLQMILLIWAERVNACVLC
jgi:hypothetical protein